MGFLITVAIILGVVAVIGLTVKSIINNIKQSGISEIIDMVREAEVQYDTTPKSISGGDRIYLPKILRDYPDFDVEKAKAEVEKTISLIFHDIERLEGNALISAQKLITHYSGNITALKIHNTAISNYIKSKESATIKFQTAFEIKENDKLNQERYETEYALFFKSNDEVVSFSCENCGAPLSSLNNKTCAYCGNSIAFMQERVWVVNSIIMR